MDDVRKSNLPPEWLALNPISLDEVDVLVSRAIDKADTKMRTCLYGYEHDKAAARTSAKEHLERALELISYRINMESREVDNGV